MTDPSSPDASRIATSRTDQAIFVAVVVVVGVVAGLLVRWAPDWLLALPLPVIGGPLETLAAVASGVPVWTAALVGALVGAVVGLLLATQATSAMVSDREIVVTAGSRRQRFAKSEVAEAGVQDKHLVLRDADDVELLWEKIDGDPDALISALRHHGWPDSPSQPPSPGPRK